MSQSSSQPSFVRRSLVSVATAVAPVVVVVVVAVVVEAEVGGPPYCTALHRTPTVHTFQSLFPNVKLLAA